MLANLDGLFLQTSSNHFPRWLTSYFRFSQMVDCFLLGKKARNICTGIPILSTTKSVAESGTGSVRVEQRKTHGLAAVMGEANKHTTGSKNLEMYRNVLSCNSYT